MSLGHLFRYGRTLTPASAITKAGRYLLRLGRAKWSDARNAGRCTYPPLPETAGLAASPLNGPIPVSCAARLAALAERYGAHRFDLLGSGWIEPARSISPPPLSPGNRARSSDIRTAISAAYSPIDWQLDFRSGYRWREDKWSTGIAYGHEPGIDIKVPWELARLQHLVQLALAATAPGADAEGLARECRDQMLDFMAANPPGYGVNWACTMDVAIRAANMTLAHWLMPAAPGGDDSRFNREFAASLRAHGRHIMANLENTDDFRGNHYLADVCGLAFASAALQPDDETRAWWQFAKREIVAEIGMQFLPDGANFEASTCYHRLSAEMATYAVALILGRDDVDGLPADMGARLHRMAHFTMDVTKPDGRVAQIGDNDNGRFFKPGAGHYGDDLDEDHLDHRGLVAAIGGIVSDGDELLGFSGGDFATEARLAAMLAAGRRLESTLPAASAFPIATAAAPAGTVIAETVIPLAAGVLDGLSQAAYPDFGVFIWKSPRFFLVARCGPVGQNGRGGHAHNDQLAIELQIDGTDWLADPGSYVYTTDAKARDAYRSVTAHAAPRRGDAEPSPLDHGMFRLGRDPGAQCLAFGPSEFEGMHGGFGAPIHRAIRIEAGNLRIRDATGGPVDWDQAVEGTIIETPADARRHFDIRVPFSPGYGALAST